MAIRTVSNAGGEWSSAATWVGGVKPIVGKDSVAFTATSGNLLIDGAITVDTTIKGIDFRNYVNTLTLRGTRILIDDQNTSGRASFINFGTGGYTVVAREYLSNNIINPADNTSIGILIAPDLSQDVTITSNGTAWNQYIQFGTINSQVISLADTCTINGRWDMDFTGTIFQNNRIIFNGNPVFDMTPGFEFAGTQIFVQCTSTVEINSPLFYSNGLSFDGNRFELNSPVVDFDIFFSGISFANTLGTPTVVVITTPTILGYITNISNDLTLTANNLIGKLDNNAGNGVYNFTNVTGDVESVQSGGPGYTLSLTVSGTITGDIDISNDLTSITANTINTGAVGCQIASVGNLTFNVLNLTVPTLTIDTSGILTIGSFSSFNITTSIYLRSSLAGNTLTYTFPNLNLTTFVQIQAPTTNITFAGLTVPTLTIISTTASTLNLGATSGSVTTLNMTTPVASINKNNCAITTATITSTTSATFTGGSNNTFTTLNTTAPLLVLDAANVMNSTTNINLTTNTTRTIQLTSAMDVNSIICVNTNVSSLTFTGSFDATIGIIDRIIALNLVANRQYTITQNAFLYNCTIASTTPGTRAKFDMIGANEPLINVNATDIDSSLTPRGVHTYFGTVTNCLNWRNFSDSKLPQVCSTF